MVRYRMFHVTVKIDFKGKRCGVENRSAILALRQVALDLTCHMRREAPFQVFTNQPNCCFAGHAYNLFLSGWALNKQGSARRAPKRSQDWLVFMLLI
jgi:hypothetical protein